MYKRSSYSSGRLLAAWLSFLLLFVAVMPTADAGGPQNAITYNANGAISGTPPQGIETLAVGATVTVEDNTGSLDFGGSHTFVGWKRSDEANVVYLPGSQFIYPGTPVVLTPVDEANEVFIYIIFSEGDVGSVSYDPPQKILIPLNKTVILKSPGPGTMENPGYTFAGWIFEGTTYPENAKITMTTQSENLELIADWISAESYAFTYYGNGHTGGNVPVTASTYATPPPSPIPSSSATPSATPNVKHILVLESDPSVSNDSAQAAITQIVGSGLGLSAKLASADEYKIILSVVAPTGEELAGRVGKLTVKEDGSATLEADLIDPYGIVTDALTGKPIEGVKMTLHWSDTVLNRAKNRTVDGLVILPELPDFQPNKNHDPQSSNAEGQNGWMVFPDGDYYILGEKDGYVTFDSRKDARSAQMGDDSYVRGGIIHVGRLIVTYDIQMQPTVVSTGVHEPYMIGYPDGSFHPERGITRAEFTMILSRVIAVDSKPQAERVFADVESSFWAADAIRIASVQGWMNGYEEGDFRPNRPVTRAEFPQALARAWKWKTEDGKSTFADVSGHWGEQAIAAVERKGLLAGYPDGSFKPDQEINREEAVGIVNRLLDRETSGIGVVTDWPDVPKSRWSYKDIMEASIRHSFERYSNGGRSKRNNRRKPGTIAYRAFLINGQMIQSAWNSCLNS